MTQLEIQQNIKRWFKRSLIRIISWFIHSREQYSCFEGSPESIAILAQERLGDAILLTPLLRNLKKYLPDIRIHIIALSPVSYNFFKNDPNIDVVFFVKSGYWNYLRKILKLRYDILFNTKDHPSFTFIYQTLLIRAKHKVGINHSYHRKLFNYYIDIDFHEHIVNKNCAFLHYLNISYNEDDCRPYLPQEKISAEVESFLKSISDKQLIGINLSAGEKVREWPLAKWEEFISKTDKTIVIFAMPDRFKDKAFLEKNFDNTLESPRTGSLYEAAQIVRYLELLITPDTSLIHVASCFSTPLIGLYRNDPLHHTRFSPYLSKHVQVIAFSGEIGSITADEVLQAVEDIRHIV